MSLTLRSASCRAGAAAILLSVVGSLSACDMALNGRAERALTTTEPAAAQLEVDTRFLDVYVVQGSSNSIDIRGNVVLRTSGGNETAEREIESIKLVVSRDGDTLRIGQGVKGEKWNYRGSYAGEGRVDISVPTGTALSLTTASGDIVVKGDFGDVPFAARSASGDAQFDGAARTAVCETASGDITLTVTSPLESFTASSASGDVRLDGGAAWAKIKTASGDVIASGLSGDAAASTASGSVRLDFSAFPAAAVVEVSTASGDISIGLPPGVRPAGTASTASGSLDIQTPVTIKFREAKLGGSDGVVSATTASGDIRIKER